MNNAPKDIFDRIMSLPFLRIFYNAYLKKKTLLLYLFFGGLTTLISISTFFLFYNCFSINELIANVFSWICAVLFAYITNRIWVFNSCSAGVAVLKEILSFFSGRLITLFIEELVLFVFITLFHINSLAVKIAAQFIVLVSNYFISKFIVFRSK